VQIQKFNFLNAVPLANLTAWLFLAKSQVPHSYHDFGLVLG